MTINKIWHNNLANHLCAKMIAQYLPFATRNRQIDSQKKSYDKFIDSMVRLNPIGSAMV